MHALNTYGAEQLTIGTLFHQQVTISGDKIAVEGEGKVLSYRQLQARVFRLVHVLMRAGVKNGDRVALLSENRVEYIELMLACAEIGAMLACCNWRQAVSELRYCFDLVNPKLIVASPRFAEQIRQINSPVSVLEIGPEYEAQISRSPESRPDVQAKAEDGLVILFTSGTTGLPKAAVISHRAMVMRGIIAKVDIDPVIYSDRYFVAWSPFFHMTSTDATFATLASGGSIVVADGFDPPRFIELIANYHIGNLVLMPGMIERVIEEIESKEITPKRVDAAGVLADLIPPWQIARITTLLRAPYRNTFGSTETGSTPGGKNFIPVGELPHKLSKRQSFCCAVRLVDADGREVKQGEPGELTIKSPGLFSGYWNAPETNATAFRNGWYHMGDVFVRNADGTLDFVDRQKYLIKSGGENIYPAEIERLLVAMPDVLDAAVVKASDAKWGEVPVAFVVRKSEQVTEEKILGFCRGKIANYKLPKKIKFIAQADIPRNQLGKVMRNKLEEMVEAGD